MPWLASICTCRYSGRYQANFDTTTCVTSAVEAMPLSISRGSTFACTTPSVQPRQAYLGRIVRSTRRIAHSRDHVQHLVHVLTNLVQTTRAARARHRVWLQHLLAARQVLGQRADVALRLLARL